MDEITPNPHTNPRFAAFLEGLLDTTHDPFVVPEEAEEAWIPLYMAFRANPMLAEILPGMYPHAGSMVN